jgi:hypothetical protein
MVKHHAMHTFFGLCLLTPLLCFSGCQTIPPSSFDSKPADELHRQLIWLKLDDLLPLEQTQRYSSLFTHMDLPTADRPGRRAQFLKLSKCAETLLGPVLQVSRTKATFKYLSAKQLYTVTLPVSRLNANVLEQWTFAVTADGSLQWKGLHWLTNRSDFLTCAATVPGLAIKQPKQTVKNAAIKSMPAIERADKPADAKREEKQVTLPNTVKKTEPHQKPLDRIKHNVTKPITAIVHRIKNTVEKPHRHAAKPKDHAPASSLSHTVSKEQPLPSDGNKPDKPLAHSDTPKDNQ